jgi:hypothetical protein
MRAPPNRLFRLRWFADPDALRYLRRFLHDEKLANSEQPIQLFSI